MSLAVILKRCDRSNLTNEKKNTFTTANIPKFSLIDEFHIDTFIQAELMSTSKRHTEEFNGVFR